MSILLTAGKKALQKKKPKSAQKKKPVRPPARRPLPPPPPPSTDKCHVWHWYMEDDLDDPDNIPVTVMFTTRSGEVWCNGETLETVSSFAGGDSHGSVVDFCIMVDDDIIHDAQIRITHINGKLNTELFVDNYMILAFNGQDIKKYVPKVQSRFLYSMPPTYDEATAGYNKKLL